MAEDKLRDLPFQQLLDLSLPYCKVFHDGGVCLQKVKGSGGVLNCQTCAQQLLYEVGDPQAYVTPDIVSNVILLLGKKLSNRNKEL